MGEVTYVTYLLTTRTIYTHKLEDAPINKFDGIGGIGGLWRSFGGTNFAT